MENQIQRKVLGINSILPFGKKHKGELVAKILKEDPSYILWALENVKEYEWSVEVLTIAHDSKVPAFIFRLDDLQRSVRLVNNLEKGLDPIGDNGVRRVHGFSDTEDVHRELNSLKKLLYHLESELSTRRSVYIKL